MTGGTDDPGGVLREREGNSSRYRDFLGRNYAVILFYLGVGLLIFYPMLLGKLVAPGDARSYYYPFKVYYSSLVSRGLPIWMPYQFAGISYLGSSESGVLYPPNFPFLASGSGYLYNLLLLLHYAAGAFFTYLYLKLICDRKLPAVLRGERPSGWPVSSWPTRGISTSSTRRCGCR